MNILSKATPIRIPTLADRCLETIRQFAGTRKEGVTIDQAIGSYAKCVDIATD
jgi:hypothetical protein